MIILYITKSIICFLNRPPDIFESLIFSAAIQDKCMIFYTKTHPLSYSTYLAYSLERGRP